VTVAVKVRVPPKTGVSEGAVTTTVGVAGVTVIEIGAVVGRAAKFPSPSYVAVTVYVPATGVAIWQV
jgi:hypothetical protein